MLYKKIVIKNHFAGHNLPIPALGQWSKNPLAEYIKYLYVYKMLVKLTLPFLCGSEGKSCIKSGWHFSVQPFFPLRRGRTTKLLFATKQYAKDNAGRRSTQKDCKRERGEGQRERERERKGERGRRRERERWRWMYVWRILRVWQPLIYLFDSLSLSLSPFSLSLSLTPNRLWKWLDP